MAFVSRSERKIVISTSDQEIPGPGQYLRMPMMKMTPQLKAPFNSSFVKEREGKKSSPGPGSYNVQPQHSKGCHDVSKADNTNSNASTVDNVLTNQVLVRSSNERLGFLTRVGRFQEPEGIQRTSQPDLHIQLKPKEEAAKRKKAKAMTSLLKPKSDKALPGSIKRIVSIPSKDMKGYVLEKNGEALMILDSILKDEKCNASPNSSSHNAINISLSNFNGTQKTFIGPRSYDVTSNWKTNAIDWKKTSSNSISSIRKNKLLNNSKSTIEAYISEWKRQGDFIPHLPKHDEKKLFYNYFHIRKRLKPLSFQSLKREERASYLTHSVSPGPGYYLSGDKSPHKGESPKYGSEAPRFKIDSNAKERTGPGSYFKEKRAFEENKKSSRGLQYKTLYQINEYTFKQNKALKCSKSFAGPGSYDIMEGFIKESQSNKELLNSGPKRFISLLKTERKPGPGEYLDQNIIAKLANRERQPKRHSLSFNINDKKDPALLQLPSSPPVGLYNWDAYDSISYKNELKLNRPQANIAPFLNTTNRFDLSPQTISIGPGAYMKDLLLAIPQTTKDACFNSKEKRFKLFKSNGNASVGPHEYVSKAKQEWDKRSFNVLFFKPKNYN